MTRNGDPRMRAYLARGRRLHARAVRRILGGALRRALCLVMRPWPAAAAAMGCCRDETSALEAYGGAEKSSAKFHRH